MNQSAVVHETLTLGGGCFWCTEAVYVRMRGVLDVESGYCNGQTQAPSYEQVCAGRTGHVEVVKLVFDPTQVSVRELLEVFFVIHDPTTLNAQGHDHGTQYRSGVYYSHEAQAKVARELVAELASSRTGSRPIVTEILPLTNYWPAEDYHQDYFEHHPQQAYCLAVAAPKVEKFRKTFTRLVRGSE